MSSVRDAFFNRIYELVGMGGDIVVVTCDLGAPSLDDFRRDYPERYISVGIAEQSLVSVSAGLALSGKKVVAYGLNPFPATRAFDQVRTLMAELNIPVILCALNAGLCSAECGYTHVPVEDMGMMRMLPNMKVVNPSDEIMAVKLADSILSCSSPSFVRFDKSVNGPMYREGEVDFEKGFFSYGSKGKCELGIVTNGCFVQRLRPVIDKYVNEGLELCLVDLYSLPVDEDGLAARLGACRKILTIEENVLPGGIGSLVLEILSDHEVHVPVKRIGLDIKKGYYNVFADRNYIWRSQGLDEASILKIIDSFVEGGESA